jgi:hypothetical protein
MMARITAQSAFAALQLTAGTALADDLSRDLRVQKGFAIAASQHITLDQDVPSQGLGSYLVTVSSCNDCHTQPSYAPGGSPFLRQAKQVNLSNYLAGGNLFTTPAGNFCSANITPQQGTGLPAGLTRDQFVHVIKTGCDPQAENFNDSQTCGLLNVMPWPNFQNYRINEISAIYDYLSALPHTEIGAGAACTPDPQGVAQ